MADATLTEPCDIHAEKQVLGCVFWDADVMIMLASRLKPDDFFLEQHAVIYGAMLERYHDRLSCQSQGILADHLERKGKLEQAGGHTYLAELWGGVELTMFAEQYAELVQECAIRRRFLRTAEELVTLAYDRTITPVSLATRASESLQRASVAMNAAGWISMQQAMTEAFDRFGEQPPEPIHLGFAALDRKMGGIRPGQLVLIAARPAVGKTSSAMQIAHFQARFRNRKVGIVSLEMSYQELTDKLIQLDSGVNLHRFQFGSKSAPDDDTKVTNAIARLVNIPIQLNDRTTGALDTVVAEMRSAHAKSGVELFIVDYLQLLEGDKKSQNRVQDVSKISRALKVLARELNVPIIALSQLSRGLEMRQDKRPVLSDLRESGSLEQDADAVIFIHRPDLYDPNQPPNIASFIVAKHRSGPTGDVPMRWVPETTWFEEITNGVD